MDNGKGFIVTCAIIFVASKLSLYLAFEVGMVVASIPTLVDVLTHTSVEIMKSRGKRVTFKLYPSGRFNTSSILPISHQCPCFLHLDLHSVWHWGHQWLGHKALHFSFHWSGQLSHYTFFHISTIVCIYVFFLSTQKASGRVSLGNNPSEGPLQLWKDNLLQEMEREMMLRSKKTKQIT